MPNRSARLLAPILLSAALGSAAAAETYTYIGQPFQGFAGDTTNQFTTSDHFELSFTVDTALPASTSYDFAQDLGLTGQFSWAAEVGGASLRPGVDNGVFYGSLQTDASGGIAQWYFVLASWGPAVETKTIISCGPADCLSSVGWTGSYAGEYVQINPQPLNLYYSGVAPLAGTWTVGAPVPEPATVALMLGGLAVIGSAARHRRAA